VRVYLNETAGRTPRLVRTVVTAMTALPSILAGLFVFLLWVSCSVSSDPDWPRRLR